MYRVPGLSKGMGQRSDHVDEEPDFYSERRYFLGRRARRYSLSKGMTWHTELEAVKPSTLPDDFEPNDQSTVFRLYVKISSVFLICNPHNIMHTKASSYLY